MGSEIINRTYLRYFSQEQRMCDYHHNWKLCEQYLDAIAAALGCPDAPVGELAGMVAHERDYLVSQATRLLKERDELHKQAEENRKDTIALIEKYQEERDELRSKLEAMDTNRDNPPGKIA